MTRRQCPTCPWRVGASVHAIPGYDPAKHRALADSIAVPGALPDLDAPLRIMACHYSDVGAEIPCAGWVEHQVGRGGNVALRLAVALAPERFDTRTDGPQRQRFEDTFHDARLTTRRPPSRAVSLRRALAEALARQGVPRAVRLVESTQRRTWRVQLVSASTSRDEVRDSVAEAVALVQALCADAHLLDVGAEIRVVPEQDGQRLPPVAHLRLEGPPPRWVDVRGDR